MGSGVLVLAAFAYGTSAGVALAGVSQPRDAALTVLAAVGGAAVVGAALLALAARGARLRGAAGAAARVLAVFAGVAGALALLVVAYAQLVPRHVGERYARASLGAYACHAALTLVAVAYQGVRVQPP